MEKTLQIDVNKIDGNTVLCGMYTFNRWVRIAMSVSDYEVLIRDGFFIRDGKSRDSANVLNTTDQYVQRNQ